MSVQRFPVRIGPAEQTLIDQLKQVGAADQAERLAIGGLPTRRVESYHYTDLKTLLRSVPPLAQPANETGAPALPVAGAFDLAIINGVVQAHGAAPKGIIVGTSEGSALTMRDDVIVRLNSALVAESLSLTLEGAVAPVVRIDRRTEGPAGHAADAVRIFVADGAAATIVEVFSGSDAAHVTNHASYVELGQGATLTHITLDLSAKAATHLATAEYRINADAQLRTITMQAGAGLARSQVFARFVGEGAHADFTGLNLVEDGQHLDITLDVEHAVPHTTSKELFKQIARGRSKAVFQGRIIVARDAQKTDAKLMMQGLMLSDEAEILSKPELEIYADDVVCGHGSTCGALDEDSMFYLMSRGIAKAEAETMLVRGFLEEILDPVTDEALHEALHGVVDGWLMGT